jgi:ABC-2 type transport system permease protein
MRKIAIIARREYQAMVRTKAFIVSLVMMPIFMFGAIFIQTYMQGRVDVAEKKIVVIDGTGSMFLPLSIMADLRNRTETVDPETGGQRRPKIVLEQGPKGEVTDELRLKLSDQVRRNEIFAFAEIDKDALKADPNSPLAKMLRSGSLAAFSQAVEAPKKDVKEEPALPAPVRLYLESITYNEIGQWFMQAVNQAAFSLRLKEAGLDPAVVANAIVPIDVQDLGLYSKAGNGEIKKGDEGSRGIVFLLPVGIMMLMFMSLMFVAQPMLTSVLEEKQQRIAEVLLGSASPFQIMMGKLVGNVAVALTIVAMYVAGAYFVAEHYGYADLLPTRLIGWFIAFQVLACLLFGAITIAIGAACTDIKETQSLMAPVMMMLVMPLMVWFTVVQEPLSSFSKWISLFPLATPMLMMLRMAATPIIPMWQPLLGIFLVLITTIACVFAAGRVFRIGLLIQGKAPKLRELVGWIVRG